MLFKWANCLLATFLDIFFVESKQISNRFLWYPQNFMVTNLQTLLSSLSPFHLLCFGGLHLIEHYLVKWKWKSLNHVQLFVTPWLYSPWNYLGQNPGVGSLSLLQGIIPTQGSNPGLPHCRRILYQLSHKGSPRMLEWVAYPFSRRSPWPRNWTGVSDPASQADSLPNSSKRQGQKVISTPLTYLSTYIVIGVHSHWSAGELFMVFTLKEFIT